MKNYTEEKFEKIICDTREEINIIIPQLTAILEKSNIKYYIPPMTQSDEVNLLAPFSYKYAAVNAGIGWIRKNGVLVTNEYGPRVRLSVILVNYNLPAGKPITESMCDSGCFACIESCPYMALKGIQLNIDMLREELVDYRLCNTKRSLYIEKHDRKNACGICMVACPLGLQEGKFNFSEV